MAQNSKRTSSFRGRVLDDVQRQKRAESSYGHLLLPKDVKVFQPELDSRVKLDFMPYLVTDPKHMDRNPEKGTAMPDSPWFKHPYLMHRGIGSANETVVCLQSIGKKCPICEHRAKLVKDGAEKSETDALKNSKRNLYIVIPLDSKKFEAVPHILDISQYLFQKLLNKELEEDPSNEVFPDLTEGKTLKVRFDSTVIADSKPFPTATRIDFIEREESYDESMIEKVPNLDEILKILSYKELEDLFCEIAEEEDGGTLIENTSEEVRKEVVKRVKKSIESPETEEDLPSWEELNGMSERRLLKIVEEKSLKVDSKDFEDNLDGLKEAIAKELNITIPIKKPVRTVTRTIEPNTTKDRCPHDHKYGIDFEKFDECPDCVLWDDCYEANKKLKK